MKNLKNILVIAIIVLATFSCKNVTQPEVKTVEADVKTLKAELDPNATYAKAEFKIEGMTCKLGCAKTIEKKMAKMEGVKSATVDYDRQLAMVEYDEAKVTPKTLEHTVTSVADKYKVKDMKSVDAFSNAKKACAADCKKACCAAKDKKVCKADCKKDCCKNDTKTKADKTACAKDCKKTCCIKEEKV